MAVTNLMRTWLAGAFASNEVLSNTLNLLRCVNKDFGNDAKAKGDRVRVPLPVIRTVADVVPAMTVPTPAVPTNLKTDILLDKWRYADLPLNAQEITQIEAGEFFVPSGLSACVVALLEDMNAFIHTKTHGANGFYGYVGTAGTPIFNTNSDILADAQEALTIQKSPLSPRKAIISTTAAKAAQKLAEFKDVSQMGNDSVRRLGQLPPVNGFDPFVDQQVPTHTAGTGAGYLVNNGAGYPAGSTAVVVDTGAGTILAGDVITFAGVTGTYNVTAALAANTFSFYPGLAGAVADNAAITLKASHTVNVAFYPPAIQLVTRPLKDPASEMMGGSANNLVAEVQMADPSGTGIVLRLSYYRGFNMGSLVVDVLYGAEVVRPEMGVRLAA